MLGIRLDRPHGREQAELHRPFVVERVDEARLDHRLPPGGKSRLVEGADTVVKSCSISVSRGMNLNPTVKSPCHSFGGPAVRRR